MTPTRRRLTGPVPAALAAGLIAISLSVQLAAQAAPASASLTEWDIFAGTGGDGTASQNVTAILMDVSGVAGPAGNVWVTTQNPQPRLGRLDPAAGSNNYVEWLPVPSALAGGPPLGLALNRSNADIWVSMQGDPAFVLKLGTGNNFRHFRSTYPFVPQGIAVASDHALFAAIPSKNAGGLGNAIIKIPRNPTSGQVTVSIWNVAGEPRHVALDTGGNVWFSERSANKLGRLNPATGVVTEWLLPAGTKPMGVDVRGTVVCVASEGAPGALTGVVNCLNSTNNQITLYSRAPGDGFDLSEHTAVNSDTETFVTEQNGNSLSFVAYAARAAAPVSIVTPTTRTVSPATTKLNVTDYTATPVTRTVPSAQSVISGVDDGGGYVRFTLPLVAQTFPFEQDGNPQPVSITPVFNDLGRGTGTVFFAESFDGPVLGRTPGGRVGRLALGGTPPASATIITNPTSLQFDGIIGGGAPGSQAVAITEASGSALTWSATKTAAWLTLSPITGSAPSSMTVTANQTSLAAGTYTDTITVDDGPGNASAKTIAVTLNVTGATTIALAPSSLSFQGLAGGARTDAQTFQVTNTGSNALEWTATASADWIIVGPASGTAPSTLTVRVDPGALGTGTHNGSISVASSGATNSPRTVTVTAVVTAPPAISANQSSLTFSANRGSNPANQTLRITNTGGGTLSFTPSVAAGTPGDWLALSPSGTVSLSAGAFQDFTVSVSGSSLLSGNYAGSITIADALASNGPVSIPVSLTVNPRGELGASPASFTVTAVKGGANPANQLVSISNSGDASFNYTTGAPSAAWLTVAGGGSGTVAASGSATLTLAINIAGLAKGSYVATVQVSSANANNSPQTITVNLTVQAATINAPTSVSHSVKRTTALASQTVAVSNTGDAALNYTASVLPGATWLTIAGGATGTVAPGGSASPAVQYTINTASPVALTSGNYTGTIQIADPNASNSPKTITVNLTVTAASTLSVSPMSIPLTVVRTLASPPNQTVTVSNSGDSTLNYTASVTSGGTWLSITSGGGGAVAPAGSANLALALSTVGLAKGVYVGTVDVADPNATNATQTVTVTLTVTAPTITPNQASLAFTVSRGNNPATQTVRITNTGDATLTFTPSVSAGAPGGWLAVSPSTQVSLGPGAFQDMVVTVTSSALSSAAYSGSITVSDTTATNSPQTIPVALTVNPYGTLSPSPMTFNVTAVKSGANPANQLVTITNTGDAAFSYTTGTPSAAWLTVASGGSGTVNAGDNAGLSLAINTAGLAKGNYSATVQVSSADANSSPQTITVNLTVQAPTIGLSPTTIPLSVVRTLASPANQTVAVSNTGDYTLNYTAAVTAGGSWLSISSGGSGAVAPAGSSNLVLAFTTTALAKGSYVGTIQVTDPSATNTPQTVTVNLTVTAPTITPNQASLSFSASRGNNPSTQTLRITNSGDATLTFTPSLSAGAPGGWLGISPSGPVSIAGGAFQDFTVTVTSSALSSATYNGSITVTDTTATNSPQSIPVTLTVNPYGTISPSPTTFNVTAVKGGSNPSNRVVTITNTGDAAFSYTTGAPSAAWLTVASGGSGTVNAGGNASLSLAISIAGLAKGNYSATVQVSSANANSSPQTITVNLTVQAPTINLSTISIPLTVVRTQASPADQTVSVGNTGDATLNYTATVTAGGSWLSLFSGATGAVAASGSSNMVLRFNTTALAKGNYTGTVSVVDPNATNTPQTVTVNLTVQAPTITPNAPSLTFAATQGFNPAATQTLRITNSGDAQLAFTPSLSAGAPGGWLAISPSGAVTLAAGAFQDFTVTVTSSTLNFGTFNGSITLTDSTASNSPVSVPVTLNVAAKGILTVPTTSFTRTATKGGANPSNVAVTLNNTGGASLPYVVGSPSAAWLTVVSAGTSPIAAGGNTTLTLGVNIAGLAKGTYNASVTVTAAGAAGSPKTINVQLTVQAATIVVANTSDSVLRTKSKTQVVTVGNSAAADANLVYTASVTAGGSWLSITGGGTGTVVPGATANMTLQYNAAALTLAGSPYTGTISVAAPAATNTPQTITVTLTVLPIATIQLQNTGNNFANTPAWQTCSTGLAGSVPATTTLRVRNNGDAGSILNYSVSDTGNWLSFTPASGALAQNAFVDLVLTADMAPGGTALTAATYSSTITVADPNATTASTTDTTQITVQAPGTTRYLCVIGAGTPAPGVNGTKSFGNVTKGTTSAAQTLTIRNSATGGTAMPWTIAVQTPPSAGTVNLGAPTSGSLAAGAQGNTGNITITVPAGTASGNYSAVIRVTGTTAQGSPKDITVTWTVP